jgi:flavin reductase (DIM6/NTAB) family NADH-FMN oxidoreductase RutF
VTATAEGFRTLFRQAPQAVWILTTRDPVGGPVGITVSSLTPVSTDPPTVVFSLQNTASVLPVFAEVPRILAHGIEAGGEDTARHFAASGIARFHGTDDTPGTGGLPVIDDAYGRLFLRVSRVLPVAASALFICTMESTWLPETPAEPAVYRNRAFTRAADSTPAPFPPKGTR